MTDDLHEIKFPRGARRPVTFTVFGVLSLVFGGLAFSCNGCCISAQVESWAYYRLIYPLGEEDPSKGPNTEPSRRALEAHINRQAPAYFLVNLARSFCLFSWQLFSLRQPLPRPKTARSVSFSPTSARGRPW
jgi:hypothetical protein